MTTVNDVPTEKLIQQIAEGLKAKEQINLPEWARFVKTGPSRERPPVESDWWYMRTASILRIIFKKGPIGVNKLRLKYGGKKNRGHKPERFYKSSGKIIRVILQQLEAAGLIEQKAVGVHKGRVVTKLGTSFVDKVADGMVEKTPVKKKVKSAVPKEDKKAETPKELPKAETPKELK